MMSPQTETREAGVLIPLWTLSHQGDLGIGDISSLRKLIPWIADAGLEFIQLLPVNETDNTNSPYSAISSIALDPIYLDLSLIPQIPRTALGASQKENRVDYKSVRKRKSNLLRKAFRRFSFNSPEAKSFTVFQEKESNWLNTYSLFRYLMKKEGENPDWQSWSPEYNTPEKAFQWFEEAIKEQADTVYQEILYYEWLQWHCHKQWYSVRKYADLYRVKLMGDIPVGVSFNSADVFFEQENFNLDWRGGAPPETFFKDDEFAIQWGQNWGIPLYNDEYLRSTGFSWWKRRVEKHTEIFSMFRIDHVLGLYRIYSFPWSPSKNKDFLGLSEKQAKKKTGGKLPRFTPNPDDTEEQQEENLERGDEILRVLQEAAGRAEIIAEDLGMTPEYVPPHLQSLEICGFKICHWESKEGTPKAVDTYPYYSFATFSTHDHPPLAALWNEARAGISDADTRINSEKTLRALAQIAQIALPKSLTSEQEVPIFSTQILWGLLHYLFQTNSKYCALMITDILEDPERFNVPSTVGDHNWSYRISPSVEDFYKNRDLLQTQKTLASKVKSLGRR